MIVGVLGPEDSVAHVLKVAQKGEPYLELIPMVYKSYAEAADLLQARQREVEGVLFTGFDLFTYVSGFVKPIVPWEYTTCDVMTLSCTILLAGSRGYDVTRMSFDGFGALNNIIMDAYMEIGYKPEQLQIHVPRRRRSNEKGYIDYLCDFHTNLFKNKKISCSIHGLSECYAKMKETEYPCFRRLFFSEPVRDQLIKLRLRHQITESRGGGVAVIAIEMDVVDHYAVYGKSELENFFKSKQAAEAIYVFGQRLGAAVIKATNGRYYIFTNTATLRNETKNFKSLDLLGTLASDAGVNRVHIGVGIGKSAFEAKSNADYGRERSSLSGQNGLYIVFNDKTVHGPFIPMGSSPVRKNNGGLQEISRKSGLGLTTLKKLDQTLKQYNVDEITPVDLARIYGVSPRSMNRIIAKLEAAGGYVQNMGVDMRHEVGRPSRLLKINLD
ncbi:MAG: hypothetical protein ACOX5A_10220 [Aminivibrio sp.]